MTTPQSTKKNQPTTKKSQPKQPREPEFSLDQAHSMISLNGPGLNRTRVPDDEFRAEHEHSPIYLEMLDEFRKRRMKKYRSDLSRIEKARNYHPILAA